MIRLSFFNAKVFWIMSTGLITLLNSNAQVTINEDDASGDASAELDIQSTTKGVIFPIMTSAQRDALKSPAAGLLIFNRTGGYHNVYDGSNWQQINRTLITVASNPGTAGTDVGVGVGISDPDNSAILHVNDTLKGFLLPRSSLGVPSTPAEGLILYNSAADEIIYYNGSDWNELSYTVSSAGAGGVNIASGILIGTGTIEASAKMEIRSNSANGLLIPRMTDAERDDIESPAEGLTIYNTTDSAVQYYVAASWYEWSSSIVTYGTLVTNPGQSCKDIYDNNPASQGVDGNYFIDPDGAGGNVAYECYCDMTRNGGGWTLVVNTGPKGSATNTTTAVGANPLETTIGTAFEKLSDADINLIRGAYATSILWLERPNGNASGSPIFFKENKVFDADAPNGSQIRHYHTTYVDAVAGTNQYANSSTYASGLSTWNATGSAGNDYFIIWDYNAEGLISNVGNYQCQGAGANNRSECNALLWVKQP